jgi:hypothetical protein
MVLVVALVLATAACMTFPKGDSKVKPGMGQAINDNPPESGDHQPRRSTNFSLGLLPERPPRIRYYLFQLLLVFIATIVWNQFVETGIGWSELKGSPFGNARFQLLNGLAIGLVGLSLGVVVPRMFPKLASTGCWVWALPTAVLSLFNLWDFMDFGKLSTFQDFFFWSSQGAGEEPIGRDLFTYPTWCCICYSFGSRVNADGDAN